MAQQDTRTLEQFWQDVRESQPAVAEGKEDPIQEFIDWGIDPRLPTTAKPGDFRKTLTVAARRMVGLDLWHQDDATRADPDPVFTEKQEDDLLNDDIVEQLKKPA